MYYTDDLVIEDDVLIYPAGVVYEATVLTRHHDGTVDLEFERDGQIIRKYDVPFSDGNVRCYYE